MAISQTKAINRLYGEVVSNGIIVNEDESIETINQLCEKKGQFIFHVDSYWSFVKSKYKDQKCIRMVFTIKEDGGKVQNIDRVIELIKNIEKTLIFVDNIKLIKGEDFIYVDVVKLKDY